MFICLYPILTFFINAVGGFRSGLKQTGGSISLNWEICYSAIDLLQTDLYCSSPFQVTGSVGLLDYF